MSATQGIKVRSLRSSLSFGAARALVRLACGFASVKLTAVYLGPSGMALVAQFNNFMSLCQGMVVGGLETAAVRLTSESAGDPARRATLLHTLGKFGMGMGLTTAAVVALASPWIAEWLLNDRGLAWVFVLGSLGILASIMNSLLLAIMSARDEVARASTSIILSTVLGLLIFAPAAMRWGIPGGLFASGTVYLGSLFITLVLVRRSSRVHVSDLIGRFHWVEAKRILAFYPMLLVHATLTPLSVILVRQHVSSVLDLNAAGLWQACWRLSETYLLIVMSMISTQFMARLGRVVNDAAALRSETLRTLGLATAGTAACAVAVYLFRDLIVHILFSHEFAPVAGYMPIQLVGDVVKMFGWTLGFVLVATLRQRWYIAIEILVPLSFVVAGNILGGRMGVSGVTTAYVISGVVQAMLSIIALRDLLFRRGKRSEREV